MSFFVTPHAIHRMVERGVNLDTVAAIIKHGKRCYMPAREAWRYTLKIQHGAPPAHVVLDKGRHIIITVYRSQRQQRRKHS